MKTYVNDGKVRSVSEQQPKLNAKYLKILASKKAATFVHNFASLDIHVVLA